LGVIFEPLLVCLLGRDARFIWAVTHQLSGPSPLGHLRPSDTFGPFSAC
jgi:hypothetical protein